MPLKSLPRFLAAAAALCTALALAACGGSGAPPPPPPPAGTVIGAAGGTVTGPNGAQVVIPAGALAGEVRLLMEVMGGSLSPPMPAEFEAVGAAFEVTPHGQNFVIPVRVNIPFDAATAPADADLVLLKTDNGAGGQWQEVIGRTATASMVSGEIISFSRLIAVARRTPVITAQPQDLSLVDGDTGKFSVSWRGAFPPFTVQWSKSNDNGATWVPVSTSSVARGVNASELQVIATASDNNALFRTQITNDRRFSTTSRSARLTVTARPQAPAIVQAPQNGTVTEGQSASFLVVASGTALNYEWRKNGTIVGGSTSTYNTGPTVFPADNAASITVRVFNSLGSVDTNASPAILTVQQAAVPIAFVTHPRDRSAVEGRAITFTVAVTGTNPTYQWERELPGQAWQAIVGETNSTLSVVAGTAGAVTGTRFRVLVGNVITSPAQPSNPATLTVLPLAAAAQVYVQVVPPNVVFTDPAFVTSAGVSYTATADLARGEFAGRSTATDHSTRGAGTISGLLQPLVFKNTSGGPLTIPAGALKARIEGTYSLATRAGGVGAEASCIALMIVQRVGVPAIIAGAGHQTGRGLDGAGNFLPAVTRITINEVNGGSVAVTHATLAGLLMELRMPAIALAAGESFELYFQMQPYTIAALSTADFATVPARLSLALPPGVTLDHNGAVGLIW